MERMAPRWFTNLSIRHKIRLAILSTSSIAILLASIAIAVLQWVSTRDSMQRDLETLSEVMAANSTAAISFSDQVAAAEILSALRARPNVLVACLFSANKSLDALAVYGMGITQSSCSEGQLAARAQQPNFISVRSPVVLGEDVLGELVIVESDAALRESLRLNMLALSLIMLACLLVAYVLASILQRLISRPIIALAETTARISESNDFTIRAAGGFAHDEVGALIGAFNNMLMQVESAEHELRGVNQDLQAQVQERKRSNDALNETLEQLRNTQDQLVQIEKMASLGGLVAGVAHEINTPVGIGVTAASTLSARSHELREAFDKDALTASALVSYLEMADQSTTIILSNLERAAGLIQSFKQVAVDQSNVDHRVFNVHHYVNEVLASLRPKYKSTKIQVVVECDPNLSIDSFPGVFSQILTNLMVNALIHAFEPADEGRICLKFSATPIGLSWVFSDNGRGMPADVVAKVFDPFFTTRRGSGGSGLGMHIVYNLVTQQLGGTIRVVSSPGNGTEFHITIKSIEHVDAKSYANAS